MRPRRPKQYCLQLNKSIYIKDKHFYKNIMNFGLKYQRKLSIRAHVLHHILVQTAMSCKHPSSSGLEVIYQTKWQIERSTIYSILQVSVLNFKNFATHRLLAEKETLIDGHNKWKSTKKDMKTNSKSRKNILDV